jgi:hypothetical protein
MDTERKEWRRIGRISCILPSRHEIEARYASTEAALTSNPKFEVEERRMEPLTYAEYADLRGFLGFYQRAQRDAEICGKIPGF